MQIEKNLSWAADGKNGCRLVNNITPMGRDVKAELSYPLSHRSERALLRHALSEVDSHLGVDHTPVLPPAGPLFRDIHHGQIQHFQQAVIGGKDGFGFGHLTQLAVIIMVGCFAFMAGMMPHVMAGRFSYNLAGESSKKGNILIY